MREEWIKFWRVREWGLAHLLLTSNHTLSITLWNGRGIHSTKHDLVAVRVLIQIIMLICLFI